MTASQAKTIKKIALLTSGGDAPGMNAAIRSTTLYALHHGIEVIGFRHGYNGLINNEFIRLDEPSVREIVGRGGTILKSARCEEFKTCEGMKQAAKNLSAQNIDALIVIGGDGSFAGLVKFKQFYSGQTIGIPGTIDNDIDGTDHTIGFATAVDTAVNAIDKIRDTADAFERIFVVEVMGRKSGFLALNVGVACAAEHIITFENFSNPGIELQHIATKVERIKKHRGKCSHLIVSAENLYPGGANKLASDLADYAAIECIPCILGYIQRGGDPVAKDRILATHMGAHAIQELLAGNSDIMIGIEGQFCKPIALSESVEHHKGVNQNLLDIQESLQDLR
ncbi:ATP-dependent 6-phosphofructokinase [Thalassotalea litorea]|uniref:6-phosphofructokinase n=1 Tax=Thalassotalea litorea TaxID=2020715 RepID=A0A5R9ILR7_9GAMM|nr:ATP-dependent 6-phosphofructokinase [Thalassotalea litorea]TLU66222.1 ATP-dependent 6-phosphofructokinase [Thalassotalea litorea]